MMMMMMIRRMSRLLISDMEGFLKEYREGTRRSSGLSEFSILISSPFRMKDARKLLGDNHVAAYQILCHLDI